jgi:hypothetical protein
MVKKPIFDNFSEYWYYARSLSENQRKIIFRSLSREQKASLDSSYRKDGWNDVFYRNEINERLDELKEAYGYDVIDIRIKVLKGKSVYVPSSFWQIVEEQMSQYRPEVTQFAVCGLGRVVCKVNPEVCLIVHGGNESSE